MKTIFLFLALVMVPLRGCGGGTQKHHFTTELLDFSTSRPDTIAAFYRAQTARLVNAMQRGDCIYIDVVHEQPVDTNFPVGGCLESNDNPLVIDSARKALTVSINKGLDSMLAHPTWTNTSRLVESLEPAANMLAKYPGFEHDVILMTDGLEYSGSRSRDKAGTDRRILDDDTLPPAGLPDLHGARIRLVVTAGHDADTLTADQGQAVKRYWKRVIRAAHGRLDDADYGGTALAGL